MLEAKHVQSNLKWSIYNMWKSNTSSSFMKKLLETKNLSIESRVKFVTWVNMVKASGLLPGMYRLVSVLYKG